ncbi:signal-regulatory protein beta-1 [Ailuropoda melanoleuca]|uniref:signal-regulatory protein beta-1 n=1 Tax=Ailuropoda melanoleuca TaxID=9646 RepID=UPI00059B4DA8|nr:signal-regulatory protein beta-1 [Ailuropoda melanoleuca]
MPVPASQPCPPLPSLLLTLLLRFTGTSDEDFQVIQPESSVSVRAGEILTLGCNVSARSPAGPVLWFRENGQERQLIYNFSGSQFPRVTQVENSEFNQTDYSIRISDVSPKDVGTYYCVKLTIAHPDMAYVSGSGTVVSVNGEYSLTPSPWFVKMNFFKPETCTKPSSHTRFCAPSITNNPVG